MRALRGHGEELRSGSERPGGATTEAADKVAVESPGLKGSWKKLRLYTMKRVQERVPVKAQPSCSRKSQHFREANALGQLGTTKNSCGGEPT